MSENVSSFSLTHINPSECTCTCEIGFVHSFASAIPFSDRAALHFRPGQAEARVRQPRPGGGRLGAGVRKSATPRHEISTDLIVLSHPEGISSYARIDPFSFQRRARSSATAAAPCPSRRCTTLPRSLRPPRRPLPIGPTTGSSSKGAATRGRSSSWPARRRSTRTREPVRYHAPSNLTCNILIFKGQSMHRSPRLR